MYHPQFFTLPEFGAIERLAGNHYPQRRDAGREEAGVAEFIDFMVSSDPEVQYSFRTGLRG